MGMAEMAGEAAMVKIRRKTTVRKRICVLYQKRKKQLRYKARQRYGQS